MATQPEEIEDVEEELIPVETPPADQPNDEDADDEEDERRAAPEDDDDEDSSDSLALTPKRKRKRRTAQERRRAEYAARERDRIEKEFLRDQLTQVTQRLAAVEGIALNTNEQTIDQRILAAQQRAENAKMIAAKAIDAGNGEDAMTAQSFREEALLEVQQLTHAKQRMTQLREQVGQPDNRIDQRRNEWLGANASWYGKPGFEEDTAAAQAVATSLAREGYDAGSVEHWQELNRRLAPRFDDTPATANTPRRKPTPAGNPREQAPPSARREVYVTPERKQAMLDAGIWDNPTERNKMLKYYQKWDRENPDGQKGAN